MKDRKDDAPVVPLMVYDIHQVAQALRISKFAAGELVRSGQLRKLNLMPVNGRARRRGQPMRRTLIAAQDLAEFIERSRG